MSLSRMKACVLKHVCQSFKILSFLYSTSAAGFVYVFYENAKAALFHTIKVNKSSFRKDQKNLQNSSSLIKLQQH